MGSSLSKKKKQKKKELSTHSNEIPIVLIAKGKTYPNELGDINFDWQCCSAFGDTDKEFRQLLFKNKDWKLYYEKNDSGKKTCYLGNNHGQLHYFTEKK